MPGARRPEGSACLAPGCGSFLFGAQGTLTGSSSVSIPRLLVLVTALPPALGSHRCLCTWTVSLSLNWQNKWFSSSCTGTLEGFAVHFCCVLGLLAGKQSGTLKPWCRCAVCWESLARNLLSSKQVKNHQCDECPLRRLKYHGWCILNSQCAVLCAEFCVQNLKLR